MLIDTNLASDNSSHFRKNPLERIQNLVMRIDDKIKDEKIQLNFNREAEKISTLSSGKTDKYEYLTGEEILPSDQTRTIEEAKFTYFPLGKALEKEIKTIEDQGIKQVLKSDENKQDIKSTDGVFPKEKRTNDINNEIDEIKKWEQDIERKHLKYETKKIHI